MSINDDILSRELKHRALLSLYEKKLDNDLTKVMSSHKKRLVNSTLKNGMKGSNALNRALGIETRKTYRRIYRDALKELKQLAKVDAKFQASTLNKAFGKVYRARVYTGLKVNDLIINSAGTYSQQIASISLAQQRRIKSIVKQGMVDNLAVNKIADNIGRTVDLPQAQLRTLSRTAITETSTTVNKATYKLNEDVLDGYEYVATLDSRTSLICANLDGKLFRLNDPKGIRPPQHFNCRSTTIPIVKSHEDLMNTDSTRISKRRLKRMKSGKRASFNGQVPSETKFEDFFKNQDNDFKLAVLGNQKRVDIYNTGKLKFKQFSTKDGKLVSIDRLNEILNNVKTKPPKPTIVPEVVLKSVKSKVKDAEIGHLLNTGTEKTKVAFDVDFNSQLTDQQKIIVNGLDKPNVVRNHKAGKYYSSSRDLRAELNAYDKGVNGGKVKSYVIAHEYGHHIDYVSASSTGAYAYSESAKEFLEAVAKDRKRFMGRGKYDQMQKFKDKLAKTTKTEIYSKNYPDMKIGTRISSGLYGDGYGEVSDIIDALTKGYFRKNYNMWGHSISYWKRSGATEKEIFANMFSLIHDKKAWKLVEEIAPETSKVFIKRLNELEKLVKE